MSSIFKIFAISLLAISITYAQEGEKKSPNKKSAGVGVRVAFDYNFMFGLDEDWNVYTDSESDDVPSGIGFEAGITARLQMLPFMQFTPEVLFNYTKLTEDDGGYMERNFTQISVEFPLLLRLSPIEKLYLAFGPDLMLNISDEVVLESGEMEVAGDKFSHDFPENFERKSFLFGITFGVGYYIIDKLSFDFRINIGLTDVYEGESLLIDLKGGKQTTLKFGLNYWFI